MALVKPEKGSSLIENVKYDWTAPVKAPLMTPAEGGRWLGRGNSEIQQRGPSIPPAFQWCVSLGNKFCPQFRATLWRRLQAGILGPAGTLSGETKDLGSITSRYSGKWARTQRIKDRTLETAEIEPAKDRAFKKLILTYWKLYFLDRFNLGKKKRNLIISVCIKLSRNLEILDFVREQILSKNLGESRARFSLTWHFL